MVDEISLLRSASVVHFVLHVTSRPPILYVLGPVQLYIDSFLFSMRISRYGLVWYTFGIVSQTA